MVLPRIGADGKYLELRFLTFRNKSWRQDSWFTCDTCPLYMRVCPGDSNHEARLNIELISRGLLDKHIANEVRDCMQAKKLSLAETIFLKATLETVKTMRANCLSKGVLVA